MKSAIITVSAILYAVGLWLFAPQSRWLQEVETAKGNRNRLTATIEPEPIEPEPVELEPIIEAAPIEVIEPEPEAIDVEPLPAEPKFKSAGSAAFDPLQAGFSDLKLWVRERQADDVTRQLGKLTLRSTWEKAAKSIIS